MYDFIIVGAGSAGCVLANRLSASGAAVLLLEAGGPDNHPAISIPALHSTLHDTAVDWGYRTVPQVHLNRRRIFCPRGRVLGGTSSINYMVYIRGNRGDYDHWAQLGNVGWTYDDVLPYFRRSECNAGFQDDFHGSDGPLHVTNCASRHPLTMLFMEAAEEAGLPRTEDFNGATQSGYGFYQATIGPGGRASTAATYLRPVIGRPNLTVSTHALACRLLIEGSHAVGLQYLTADGLQTAYASCETILCGGAINSPQLLMLSGIGPGDEVRAVGIEPKHNLPGVGMNLQDHLNVRLRYEITEPLTLFGLSPTEVAAAQREFVECGTGLFASNYLEAGAFFKCNDRSEYADTQLFLIPSFGNEISDGGAPDRHGFALIGYVNRPESRGKVRVISPNPLDRPLIDPNYLSEPEDLDLAIESMYVMRRIGNAAAFQPVGATEVYPGEAVEGRDDLVTYIRRTATTTWHQSGTCKMGVDEMAVVDPALRVRGVEQLRIVDASVMPTVVSGNTNAPTIMIAEKAADLILEQHGAS